MPPQSDEQPAATPMRSKRLVGKTSPVTGADSLLKPSLYLSVLALIYGLTIYLSLTRLWSVPTPLPIDGDASKFSEARALRHVKALTDIGYRIAGQPEIDAAAEYLVGEGRKLAEEGKKSRRDLLVQVQREQVSGAVETSLLNSEFINVYNNLTNVVLAISPVAALREKAVLVNAHFDSTLGTEGASDDASSVGVILEAARTIIVNPKIELATPVVFLMNGGEEALCPAAHGFMAQSPWARQLGVFLNLESTGPLGPDFVFQHTGRWPMQAFAAAAPYPHGSVLAQDFFELGVVPADTDYRMFSSKIQGRLPGLDTALLLGAGMYHTDRDSFENIRPGTLQAMGQNAVAVTEELSKQLALRTRKGAPESETEGTIFFDVLGLFMVVYPFSWAKLVHSAPLALALTLPFLQSSAFEGRSTAGLYAQVCLEALLGLVSIVCGVLASAFVGILRVTALGAPMAWYGNEVLPYAIMVPAAVGGQLLPHLWRSRPDPRISTLGSTLAFSLLGAGLTSAGLGASFVAVIWALAGLITLTDLHIAPGTLVQRATVNSVWPIVIMMPNAIAFASFVLQKSSFMGAQGQPDYTPIIADGVAGVVIGLVTVSVTGVLTPVVAYATGKALRRTVLLLFCVSAVFALQASFATTPYTRLAPKKVPIQHLHEHDAEGRILRSVFAIGAVDSVPVDNLLAAKKPGLWSAPKSGWEYLTLYPLGDEYIKTTVLQAPGPLPDAELPSIELVDRKASKSGSSERIRLRLHMPKPGFVGCLKFSGHMLDWSLPQLKTLGIQAGQPHDRYVRIVGYAGRDSSQEFWVDVTKGSQLLLRVALADPLGSRAVDKFSADWPAWTFVINLETFASSWTF